MNSKKIIVTGGAGFIGSAIVKKLQSLDHEVYVIDNLSFGNRDYLDLPDHQFYFEDIRNADALSRLFREIDPEWLIHLAAVHFIPYCNQNPLEASTINIQGTINILDACKELKNLRKIFFASTAAVYPICSGPLGESHRPAPLDIYGVTKLAGERICREFYLETGIETLVCRFFNAFGPNETNPHLIPSIERQIKSGSRKINLGNLDPKRDFIHTYDMSEAVVRLMNLSFEKMEIFNLGQGKEYSVLEIINSFERQLGEKLEIVQDQSRIRKVDRSNLLADISKIKLMTGWEPVWTIDQGIKSLLESD